MVDDSGAVLNETVWGADTETNSALGPDAALCHGVYGSEGSLTSAVLAREVVTRRIIPVSLGCIDRQLN